jgi:hypothetical protein
MCNPVNKNRENIGYSHKYCKKKRKELSATGIRGRLRERGEETQKEK